MESNPGPLVPHAKSLTTLPPPFPLSHIKKSEVESSQIIDKPVFTFCLAFKIHEILFTNNITQLYKQLVTSNGLLHVIYVSVVFQIG